MGEGRPHSTLVLRRIVPRPRVRCLAVCRSFTSLVEWEGAAHSLGRKWKPLESWLLLSFDVKLVVCVETKSLAHYYAALCLPRFSGFV